MAHRHAEAGHQSFRRAPTRAVAEKLNDPAMRAVRRAYGAASSGRRSAKIRRSQRSFWQRQRVSRARIMTGVPQSGKILEGP